MKKMERLIHHSANGVRIFSLRRKVNFDSDHASYVKFGMY